MSQFAQSTTVGCTEWSRLFVKTSPGTEIIRKCLVVWATTRTLAFGNPTKPTTRHRHDNPTSYVDTPGLPFSSLSFRVEDVTYVKVELPDGTWVSRIAQKLGTMAVIPMDLVASGEACHPMASSPHDATADRLRQVTSLGSLLAAMIKRGQVDGPG